MARVGGVVQPVRAGLRELELDAGIRVLSRPDGQVDAESVDGHVVRRRIAAAAGQAVGEDNLVARVEEDADVADLIGADARLGLVAPQGVGAHAQLPYVVADAYLVEDVGHGRVAAKVYVTDGEQGPAVVVGVPDGVDALVVEGELPIRYGPAPVIFMQGETDEQVGQGELVALHGVVTLADLPHEHLVAGIEEHSPAGALGGADDLASLQAGAGLRPHRENDVDVLEHDRLDDDGSCRGIGRRSRRRFRHRSRRGNGRGSGNGGWGGRRGRGRRRRRGRRSGGRGRRGVALAGGGRDDREDYERRQHRTHPLDREHPTTSRPANRCAAAAVCVEIAQTPPHVFSVRRVY